MHTKICIDCGIDQAIECFYVHRMMADGHLNKCKTCVKARIKRHRRANPDVYSERERVRFVGERRAKILGRKPSSDRSVLAARAVNNAVRDRRLVKPDTCSVCGRKPGRIEGHHDDYSQPLSVRWLCTRCHRRWHADNPQPYVNG